MSRGFHPLEIAVIIVGPLYSTTCLAIAFALAYNNSQKGNTMNLLNIRTLADARAFLHVFLPALAGVLVAASYVSSADAGLWLALAVVVLDAGLSTFNTASGFRKFLYPALVAGGALLVRYGYTTDATWALWTGLAPVVFGGGIAAANTDTSPA